MLPSYRRCPPPTHLFVLPVQREHSQHPMCAVCVHWLGVVGRSTARAIANSGVSFRPYLVEFHRRGFVSMASPVDVGEAAITGTSRTPLLAHHRTQCGCVLSGKMAAQGDPKPHSNRPDMWSKHHDHCCTQDGGMSTAGDTCTLRGGGRR